jgi:hypothetical protein
MTLHQPHGLYATTHSYEWEEDSERQITNEPVLACLRQYLSVRLKRTGTGSPLAFCSPDHTQFINVYR